MILLVYIFILVVANTIGLTLLFVAQDMLQYLNTYRLEILLEKYFKTGGYISAVIFCHCSV